MSTGSGELTTDAPTDNQGLGRTFSPTDLVATALVTCAMTTMAIKTRDEDIPLAGMRATVEKVMSQDAPRRIVALPVKITVPGNPTPDQRKRLEEIARSCPVAESVHPAIETPMEFVYGAG